MKVTTMFHTNYPHSAGRRVVRKFSERSLRFTRQLLTLCLGLAIVFGVTLPAPAAAQVQAREAGIQLLRSDHQGILLELRTQAYTLTADVDGLGTPCQRVESAGAVASAGVGLPELPTRVEMVAVPMGVTLSIHATALDSEAIADAVRICPVRLPTAGENDAGLVRYTEEPAVPDAAVYANDAFYPTQLALFDELGMLRSQRLVRVEVNPFQVNPHTGQLIMHRRLQVELRFEGGEAAVHAAALEESPAYEGTLAGALLNYESARAWRSRSGTVRAAAADSGKRPPANSYRVEIEDEGIYELTYDMLLAAGLPIGTLDPASLRMLYKDKEIAIEVIGEADGRFDPNDRILFYGRSQSDKYSGLNSYWLTYGGKPGLRIPTRPSGEAGTARNAYTASARVEDNVSYVSSLPKQKGYDHWYGRRITAAGAGMSDQVAYTFATDYLAAGDWQASLTLAIAANVRGDHHIRLSVNGAGIYDGLWNGRTYTTIDVDFDNELLVNGMNEVVIELINDAGDKFVDLAYVDWLELRYQRRLVATNNLLQFSNEVDGNARYTLSGFMDGQIDLFDVTNPRRVERIKAAKRSGGLRFDDAVSTVKRYIALSPARRLQPVRIVKAVTENLLTSPTPVDYIVITHPDFAEAIQPLVQHRQAQGVRVRVVDVNDIYDTFNDGRVSALAIQDFLQHAYENWPQPAPAMALLVGDGNYDLHRYLNSSAPTYIPPLLAMVDPELGETAADNRFGAVAGDDIMADISIGRFPVNSVAEVEAMVAKTIRYEQPSEDDSWRSDILFISDNLKGGGGSFYNFSNAVADGMLETDQGEVALVPSGNQKVKLYLGDTCADEDPATQCRQSIVDEINSGVRFVSYVGHGTKQYWAEEKLMDIPTAASLDNAERLPIMLPMTCLEGYFHEADRDTDAFGERIVRMRDVGAVASWSPTGLGLVTGHDLLEKGFFVGVYHQNFEQLGMATDFGKLYLMANSPAGKYDDLIETFALFGDPGLNLSPVEVPAPVAANDIFLPYITRP